MTYKEEAEWMRDRIYRIQSTYTQNGENAEWGQVSGGVSAGFMREVPGVEYGTRTTFQFDRDIYLDENDNKLQVFPACKVQLYI